MIRKIAMAGAAGAVALSGLAFVGGSVATAAPITITAGPGSSLSCSLLPTTAKVKPALKDNWVKADHQTDASAPVRALNNTAFALNGPVTVSSKPKTNVCTGNLTGGGHTATSGISGSITLGNDPAHPGAATPASCANLIVPDPLVPSTARYNITIKWKATGFKVTNTTVTGAEISSAGGTFSVINGTITGSFAGGTSNTTSSPDLLTIGAFLTSTALNPTLVGTGPAPQKLDGGPCQPKLTVKAATGTKPASATLKAGKGIKSIGLASGTLTISR